MIKYGLVLCLLFSRLAFSQKVDAKNIEGLYVYDTTFYDYERALYFYGFDVQKRVNKKNPSDSTEILCLNSTIKMVNKIHKDKKGSYYKFSKTHKVEFVEYKNIKPQKAKWKLNGLGNKIYLTQKDEYFNNYKYYFQIDSTDSNCIYFPFMGEKFEIMNTVKYRYKKKIEN